MPCKTWVKIIERLTRNINRRELRLKGGRAIKAEY